MVFPLIFKFNIHCVHSSLYIFTISISLHSLYMIKTYLEFKDKQQIGDMVFGVSYFSHVHRKLLKVLRSILLGN